MKQAGLKAARLDYMYFKQYDLGGGNNYFDILTDGGFASLNCMFYVTGTAQVLCSRCPQTHVTCQVQKDFIFHSAL